MSGTAVALTVAIITKDRPDDLKHTSLPSLQSQTIRSFNILVWDASAGDATRLVVADFAAGSTDMSVRHAHAPRCGTSRQRNDVLDACVTPLLLYLDDDVALFPTAIAELLRVFDADVPGRLAGCQCTLVSDGPSANFVGYVRRLWYRVWGMWYVGTHQAVRLSGFNTALRPTPAADAGHVPAGLPPRTDLEWLSGCAMAFRRDILVRHKLRFDERLMRFGPYGRAEDLMFSGLLHLRYGYDLASAPSALAVHHTGSGAHGGSREQAAMVVYNHWLVWKELMASRRWAHMALAWARAGMWLRYAVPALLAGRRDDLSSFRDGLRATREPAEGS
jgi:GT2 family glycosyltransferase